MKIMNEVESSTGVFDDDTRYTLLLVSDQKVTPRNSAWQLNLEDDLISSWISGSNSFLSFIVIECVGSKA